MRPNYGGPPVTVGVTLYVLSIGELSEKFMDFTFDMYFRQFWTDPRLSFERSENLEKLVVGAEYIRLIWVPDTFFVNEKIALFHQVSGSRDKYCHFLIILGCLRILAASCLYCATTYTATSTGS